MDSPILLTQSDLKNRIDVGGVKTLCLDTDWQEIKGFSAEPPQVKLEPENLSYVIFTSGSTGKPKGILLTHASNRFFNVHKKSRVLQFSSFGFDVAVWGIFMALVRRRYFVSGNGKVSFLPASFTENFEGRKNNHGFTSSLSIECYFF